MSAETFPSPGVIDLGPNNKLRAAAVAVSNALRPRFDGFGDHVRLLFNPSAPPQLNRMGHEATELVADLTHHIRTSFPDVRFVMLERRMNGAKENPPVWHTDTSTVGGTFDGKVWRYPVNPMPRRPNLMSIGGMSTQYAVGDMTVERNNIQSLTEVQLHPLHPKEPRDEDVSRELNAIYGRATGSITGTQGQLVSWQDSTLSTPEGNYDVTSVPEGNIGSMDPLTIHTVPPDVPVGRTLLYMV